MNPKRVLAKRYNMYHPKAHKTQPLVIQAGKFETPRRALESFTSDAVTVALSAAGAGAEAAADTCESVAEGGAETLGLTPYGFGVPSGGEQAPYAALAAGSP